MKPIIIATLLIVTVNSYKSLVEAVETTDELTNRTWKFYCSVEAIRVVVKDEKLGALWEHFNSDMQRVDKAYKGCPSIQCRKEVIEKVLGKIDQFFKTLASVHPVVYRKVRIVVKQGCHHTP